MKIRKLWETVIVATLTVAQHAMLLRTPCLFSPGEVVIYWNLSWNFPLGWVIDFALLSKGNYSISTGIPLSSYYPDLLKHTICTIERREKVGVLVWHILPQSISSFLPVLPTWDNMYAMHNQVKFPKLLTPFSSRQGRHVLFSPGTTIDCCLFSLRRSGGCYHLHRSPN